MWNRMLPFVAVLGAVFLALAASACGGGSNNATLTVITHDSYNITASLLKQFETDNHVTVKLVPKGDAGAMLTGLILSKSNPEGDVAFGVDNVLLGRAKTAGIFEPYSSPGLSNVPADLKADADGLVTPIDYGYVNFNYDIAALQKDNLPVPKTLEDLTDPKYKGKVVVENPASSSPGVDFLVATVGYFGPNAYLDWWAKMRKNGLVVVDSWETAYNTNFTLHGGGQPIVLSYASSPPYEQLNATPAVETPPIGNILPPKGAFRQIEYAGILKGTKHEELARKFIDFLLSKPAQEDVPGQMAVYPVDSQATVPDAFKKFGNLDAQAANVSSADIAANEQKWIDAWTQTVLR